MPKDRPRVLHVVEALIAGVATALGDYVSHDIAEHFVLAHSRGTLVEKRIHDHTARFFEMPDGHTRRLRMVHEVLKTVDPQIVHAHSSLGGVYARLTSFPRRRTVYSPHCFGFERRDVNRMTRAMLWTAEAALALRTGAFAVVSSREATLARRLSARTAIHLVPHALGDDVPSAAGVYPSEGEPLTIVTSGRVSQQKDPAFFGEAAMSDQRNGAQGRWKWIGGGDPALESDLRTAGVEVTGLIGREAALKHLAGADVYVHTAAWEGFPIAVLEAAGAGLPVVARAIPALLGTELDMIETPEELVASVRSLRNTDAWELSRQRSAGLAAKFTPMAQGQALSDLYDEVMRA